MPSMDKYDINESKDYKEQNDYINYNLYRNSFYEEKPQEKKKRSPRASRRYFFRCNSERVKV